MTHVPTVSSRNQKRYSTAPDPPDAAAVNVTVAPATGEVGAAEAEVSETGSVIEMTEEYGATWLREHGYVASTPL